MKNIKIKEKNPQETLKTPPNNKTKKNPIQNKTKPQPSLIIALWETFIFLCKGQLAQSSQVDLQSGQKAQTGAKGFFVTVMYNSSHNQEKQTEQASA